MSTIYKIPFGIKAFSQNDISAIITHLSHLKIIIPFIRLQSQQQKAVPTHCIGTAVFMQLSASESLIEVCKDILDAFGTDRKSYGIGLDTLIKKLLFGKLGMSCACGVDNKGLNICNVCKE